MSDLKSERYPSDFNRLNSNEQKLFGSNKKISVSEFKNFKKGERKKILIYRGGWRNDIPSFLDTFFIEKNLFKLFEFEGIFGVETCLIFEERNHIYFGEIDQRRKYKGKGVSYYNHGYVYRGYFENGIWAKKGELYSPEQKIYTGQFYKGSFEGQGTLYFKDGRKYIGRFQQGDLNGEAKMLYPDGSFFIGFFKEGKPTGQGLMTFKDHSYLEMVYKDGSIEGRAVFVKKKENFEEDYFLRKYKDNEIVFQKRKFRKPNLKSSICKCF